MQEHVGRRHSLLSGIDSDFVNDIDDNVDDSTDNNINGDNNDTDDNNVYDNISLLGTIFFMGVFSDVLLWLIIMQRHTAFLIFRQI